MSQNAPFSISRKRVFDSVFSPTSLKSLAPTTAVTPASAFPPGKRTAANESDVKIDESSPEQIIWDRAWHAATTFLSFPDRGFEVLTAGDPDGAQSTSRLDSSSVPSREISDSLAYLLAPSSRGKALRAGLREHDLVEWYGNEMRRHFLTNFIASFVQVSVLSFIC